MTWVDRFIQKWRIRLAGRFIPPGARVLDIGTADGSLFHVLHYLRDGIGIDPDLSPSSVANATLIRGKFPQDLALSGKFNVITILAVLEHIRPEDQLPLAKNCFSSLTDDGRVIVSVPSPYTDKIIHALKSLRLIDGMSLEQHYGYDVRKTPPLFEAAGFRTLHQKKFQFGLNNLYVFEKQSARPV